MSVGDLLHPEERWDAAGQAAIIIEQSSRWYVAHLLLFIGLLLFIPGILALAQLTSEQRPTAGYAGRILLMIGTGAFCAVFVCEMFIGRYVSDGADLSAAAALLDTFQSGWVLGAMLPGFAAFFGGIAVTTIALVRIGGRLRWPALLLGVGAFLILAEIITAEVLLSQIGNVVILAASVTFAWQILHPPARLMAPGADPDLSSAWPLEEGRHRRLARHPSKDGRRVDRRVRGTARQGNSEADLSLRARKEVPARAERFHISAATQERQG